MVVPKVPKGLALGGPALLLAFLLLVAALPLGAAADTTDPAVTIRNYQVTPSVLLPGDEGTITVTLANTASQASQSTELVQTLTGSTTTTTSTRDVTVLVESVYMYGQGMDVLEGNFQEVGALGPGQSMTLTFLVRAPPQPGMYFPEVWIRIPQGTSVKYPVPVNVNSPISVQKQAVLVLSSAVPDSANPGDEIPVALTVRNDGALLAEDVTLRIGNVSSLVAPKGSDLYHLGLVGSGQVKTTNLVLLSDKDANPGLTQVPVTVTYSSVDGVVHTQASAVNLMLRGRSELGFVSVDTSPRRVGESTPFDLTIRIENTGTGDAKQVSATVDLPMTGTKQSFIGKIKPGNDAPAVFLLDGAKGGTYPYNLTVTYVDDLGTHTEVHGMSLRVDPADSTGGYIPLLLVILAAGFLAYRFWYLPRKQGDGALPWVRKS